MGNQILGKMYDSLDIDQIVKKILKLYENTS